MKKFCWLMLLTLVFTGCKKVIEDKKEDIILDAMTSGQWYVFSFYEGTTNFTSSFSPYVFQFYRDGKVSGFTSTTEEKGTWVGDAAALTIQSEFPTAPDPVRKLNAVWKVTNSSWDYVKAETGSGGTLKQLQLKKK